MSDAPINELAGEVRSARRDGQFLFAMAFIALSVILLAFIGDQTTWVKKTKLFSQPTFWPAISLAGMVLFGAIHMWRVERKTFGPSDRAEGMTWLRSVEFALWFMAYVFAVPIIGFLPCTLVFVPALLYRCGYRSKRQLWLGVLFGSGVVVAFKGFLSVKIPGAWLYEFLPGALRNFFILNF